MAKDYACVLDFGSSKITAMIGERGINNTFNIHGTSETEYAGFYEGEFLEPEKLKDLISSTLTNVQANSGLEISKLFVGVPAEFSYAITKSAGISFNKRTKIGQDEIYSFLDMASQDIKSDDSTVINRSAIYFVLDDNHKCMNPKGQVSTKLGGEISFILADNSFIELISNILSEENIENVEFISSTLAQSIYLLDPEIRDTGALLIDCGYITTSVSLIKGDGLVGLINFSVGGGHITADLSQVLQISYKDAEALKRKVVLSLDASDEDFYELPSKEGNVRPVSAKLTNEIVTARIEAIAGLISRAITTLKGNTSSYLPVYLTGGGLSYLKGGKDFLSKMIGANIEVLSPQVPQLNRPHYSSVLGLMDLALDKVQTQKISFKEKLRRFFHK